MLKKVTIQNIWGIYKESTFDFSKSKYTYKNEMIYHEKLVNPIAIYGKNGSGKTVFLRAIDSVSKLMNSSAEKLRIFYPNFYQGRKTPSMITLYISLEGDEYVYNLSSIQDELFEEKVTVNKKEILYRKKSTYLYKGKEFKLESNKYPALRKIGREGLTKERTDDYIVSLFEYLSNITMIDVRGDVFGNITQQKSIDEIIVEKSDAVKKELKKYNDFPLYKMHMKPIIPDEEYMFFTLDGTSIDLPVEGLMSSGMRAHSTTLSTLLSLKKGSLLLIDELERSLHPFIAQKFIKRLNDYNIQVIFSTHNTSLMQVLRPDQIFFAKWVDNGAEYSKLSDIYPNIREINNIEKMYFGGLFDQA